jgi:hypothetical protein
VRRHQPDITSLVKQLVRNVKVRCISTGSGSTGTVTGWSGRSAIVALDVPNGRFAEVRCPPLGLDRIEAP